MEDEKIIGLYWERNEDAITETSSKYGKLFFRIASNILLNHEDSEECVKCHPQRKTVTIFCVCQQNHPQSCIEEV